MKCAGIHHKLGAFVSLLILLSGIVACGRLTGPSFFSARRGSIPITVARVADRHGEVDFSFQTTRELSVDLTVQGMSGPISGAVVSLFDPSQSERVLFQGITDEKGRISGRATIGISLSEVGLSLLLGDAEATQKVPVDGLLGIDRTITLGELATTRASHDADGDGVPDDLDAYPFDATRSVVLKCPGTGTSVVAYTNTLSGGDQAYNDLIVQVAGSRDLNAAGQVVRLRGHYSMLAKGGGTSHTLFLNLPGKGSVHYVLRDGLGNVRADFTRPSGLLKNLPIFPREAFYFMKPGPDSEALYDSGSQCAGLCNVREGELITPAYQAELEVIYNEPVALSEFPGPPFDLYVYLKAERREIHFPGLVRNADGTDPYLDGSGLPLALRIPGEWNWPLKGTDIRQAYPGFRPWVESKGRTNRDWYLQSTDASERHRFRYYSKSPLAAYFLQVGLTNRSVLWAFLAVMLTGLIALFFLKGRSEYEG